MRTAEIFKARDVVFVGYSLPTTDMHATALFRTSVKDEGLKTLIVVNPDRDARRRTRAVIQAGVSPNTKVLSFDNLSQFLALDHSVWRDRAAPKVVGAASMVRNPADPGLPTSVVTEQTEECERRPLGLAWILLESAVSKDMRARDATTIRSARTPSAR